MKYISMRVEGSGDTAPLLALEGSVMRIWEHKGALIVDVEVAAKRTVVLSSLSPLRLCFDVVELPV